MRGLIDRSGGLRTADGYIINKCLNGDPAAFGMLVDRYRTSVYALAYSKLQNFHDAEDVAQEVFLKAYSKLRTLKRYDSFHAWLYSITSNLCKNWIRNQSRHPDRDFINDQNQETLEEISIGLYREEMLRESIHEALDYLPENYQQVLTLYYLGGMNSREIAQFLGTSSAAIRHRLSRARARLKEGTLAMMSTTFNENGLPVSFTFRIVEAVKRMKIQPMPRTAGLPWGLSFAVGIIVTVLSLSPHLNILNPAAIPAGSPLPVEAKVLKAGEIPVDVLKVSRMPALASKEGDGGEPQFHQPQNAVFMVPQAGEGIWSGKAEMPTARAGACSATVNSRIYVIGGGKEPMNPFPTVEEYDPATDTWKRKTAMPNGRFFCSASAVNGKIYVIGGVGFGVVVPTVEEYDPATDTWEKKADMPTARCMLSTSVVDGKIYAIGGGPANAPASILSTVEEYDPVTDTWEKKTDMPTARHALSTSAADGKIYAIGGWVGGGWSSVVEEYDPIANTWIRKSPMPTERNLFSTCEVDGKIYAIGGQSNRGVFSIAESYDPATDTWTTKASMSEARAALSASVVNGKIYAIGGTTQAMFGIPLVMPVLGTVEEYDALPVPSTQGKTVEPTGKLPTKWGEIRSR